MLDNILWFENFKNYVGKHFNKYVPGREYLISVNDIKVNPSWRKHKIGEKKFKQKIRYWKENNELESKIILDKSFNLIDGYSSVRIAEIVGLEKVPVWFVE